MTAPEKRLKILVVDDDSTARLILTDLSRERGHQVQEAADGREGLKLYQAFHPDLVFSDIAMPHLDGLQLLEQIRRDSSDTIVIMTTAFETAEHTLKALRLRANDLLVKPVSPLHIIAHLEKYAAILATRTVGREILGMILHRELAMKLENIPNRVGKIVDRLMQETDGLIPNEDRLGVHLGLVEMITNAIEHGNLGITSEEKADALDGPPGAWKNLVLARQTMMPYKTRHVMLQFRMSPEHCVWTITDEGDGFHWQDFLKANPPENILAAHGRGILLTLLTFDEVTYLGSGNQVRLRKKIPAS